MYTAGHISPGIFLKQYHILIVNTISNTALVPSNYTWIPAENWRMRIYLFFPFIWDLKTILQHDQITTEIRYFPLQSTTQHNLTLICMPNYIQLREGINVNKHIKSVQYINILLVYLPYLQRGDKNQPNKQCLRHWPILPNISNTITESSRSLLNFQLKFLVCLLPCLHFAADIDLISSPSPKEKELAMKKKPETQLLLLLYSYKPIIKPIFDSIIHVLWRTTHK